MSKRDYFQEFKDWYGYSPNAYQQILPELSEMAVPRELQEAAYKQWQNKPTPENMSNALNTFGKLINSEISRYQGTLERPTLHTFAKKYVADAIRKYDPSKKVQLSTHIVHNLQRLHRLNYKNVQGLHSSEELQRNMNKYLTAKNDLIEEKGREPSKEEIAARMGSTPKLVDKLNKQLKFEVPANAMAFDPAAHKTEEEDLVMDYLYHDLNPQQKIIFEHKTGYGGKPILQNKDLAKRLGISPVRVTQISEQISKNFRKAVGEI